MSVEALRTKLFDMVKDVYEKFTIYKFKIDENDNEKVNFLEKKSINYLPDGFEEIDRAEYDNVSRMGNRNLDWKRQNQLM